MGKPDHVLIHEFKANEQPISYDEFGDVMHGYYYQIVDSEGERLSALIGPYTYQSDVERVATRAFSSRDF